MEIKNIILKQVEDFKVKWKATWDGGIYESILSLSIDERGQLGEELCVEILREKGCNVEYDPNVTAETKGYDLMSNGIKIEVKLATLGKSTASFQHESLYPQRDFEGLILIDVAPNDIYLSCIAKKDIKWKELHHRKNSGYYKMDKRLKDILDKKIKTIDDFYKSYLKMVSNIKS